MKLITKSIETKLRKAPFHSTEGQGLDAEVIVKFFNPCGAGTWLVTEGEQITDAEDGIVGDWEFFGYVTLGFEWEAGYFRLSDLQGIKGRAYLEGYGTFRLPIERDLYSKGTVKELMR